ncbi:MAG: hypothetical protein ACYTG6_16195, partial [Planctomycetota bacterium]
MPTRRHRVPLRSFLPLLMASAVVLSCLGWSPAVATAGEDPLQEPKDLQQLGSVLLDAGLALDDPVRVRSALDRFREA